MPETNRSALERHAKNELASLLRRGRGDISGEFGASFVAWVEAKWQNLDPKVAPWLAKTAAKWLDAWRRQDAATVVENSDKMYEIARAFLADRRRIPRDPEEVCHVLGISTGPKHCRSNVYTNTDPLGDKTSGPGLIVTLREGRGWESSQ